MEMQMVKMLLELVCWFHDWTFQMLKRSRFCLVFIFYFISWFC
jgi:hypothetical protein